MNIEILLSRLSKVSKVRPRRWLACCPAHAEKTPSLAITELSDGTVLLHCFSGCNEEQVLDALGIKSTSALMDSGIEVRVI
jgi:DNA primase